MEYNARSEAQIIAGAGAVAEAVAAAHDFAAGAGVAEALAQRLAVIVEEIVANIMEHGAPPVDSAISLAFEPVDAGLRLEIGDCARPFDPRLAIQPDVPPERGGGAGIALIRAWSNIESYARVDGRNTLVLLIAPA